MERNDLFSMNNCIALRAVAAISIMIGHILPENSPLIVKMLFPGYLWVGLFFLYSGYGLRLREGCSAYLEGFLKKKFIHTYIPFIIAESLYIICDIFVEKNNYLLTEIVKGCFGVILFNKALWYVLEILGIYLIYFVLTKFLKKMSITWLCSYFVFLIVFVLIDFRYNIGTSWYLSTFAFVIGWYACDIKEKFKILYYRSIKILSVMLFIILYFLMNVIYSKGIEIMGMPNNYCMTAMEMLAVVLFIWALFSVTNGANYSGKILNTLGNCSYYIYLLHVPVLIICGTFSDGWIRALLTMLITCFFSLLWESMRKICGSRLIMFNSAQ